MMKGWTWLLNSNRWHYFDEGSTQSICGKWMLLVKPTELEDDNHESPDNCASCRRVLKTREKKHDTN